MCACNQRSIRHHWGILQTLSVGAEESENSAAFQTNIFTHLLRWLHDLTIYIGPGSTFAAINPVTQWTGDWALAPPAITNLRFRSVGQGIYWEHKPGCTQLCFTRQTRLNLLSRMHTGSKKFTRNLQDLLREIRTYWFPSSSKLFSHFSGIFPSFKCIKLPDSLELQLKSKLNSALTELKNQQGNYKFFIFSESHLVQYSLQSLKDALFKISLMITCKSDLTIQTFVFFSTPTLGGTKMWPWKSVGGKRA